MELLKSLRRWFMYVAGPVREAASSTWVDTFGRSGDVNDAVKPFVHVYFERFYEMWRHAMILV